MAKRTLKLYKSYSFKDKDPIIDALRTAFEDGGETYTAMEHNSGVSYTTIHNWFAGETRRPQFATVAAVAIACGKHAIEFGSNGAPRLIGRVVPESHRAHTGRKKQGVK